MTRVDRADERTWASILAGLLPESEIMLFQEMNETQRDAAEIAIVANPDPRHVAALPNLKWIHSLWAGLEGLVAELGQAVPRSQGLKIWAAPPGTYCISSWSADRSAGAVRQYLSSIIKF
ncbi:MAG: hypothetical protein ACREEJ_14515 [Ensifer adhaerens]